MTSPNIGSAEVDIDAHVDESEFANAARRAGQSAGDGASEGFMARFKKGLKRKLDRGFDGFTGGGFLRSAVTSGAIYATRFVYGMRRTFRRLRDGLDVFTGGNLARSAAASGLIYGTRFVFAVRRALRSAGNLLSGFGGLNGGSLAAIEIAGRTFARRFADSVRNTMRRLGPIFGPEVTVTNDDGSERVISGRATRLARIFTSSFAGALRRGRGLLSGVFGRGGLLGELAGRTAAALPRLFGRGVGAATRTLGALSRLAVRATPLVGRLTSGLSALGAMALSSFGLLGKGLGLAAAGFRGILGPLARYVALAGALAVVTLPFIPLLGRLYNGLLDIVKGFGVGLPAALALAGGSFAVFKLGAEGLKQAVTPLKEAFAGIKEQLSATFLRGGIQEAARLFSRRQVPAIRRGLDQLTAGYRDFIATGLNAGAVTDFGSALERVGINSRAFLTNFSGSLVPIATILNRMLTQVSDTFPELGKRLSTFFTELEVKSRNVDFGEIFLTGIQGAINLGKAIGELGLALSEFFDAANGGDKATSAEGDGPFAGLLARVRELRDWIRENRGDIEGFFDGLGTVMGKLGTAAKGVGRFIRDVFEPLKTYFTSQEFKDGFAEIEATITRLGSSGDGKKSVGTVIGEALTAIAKTVVDDGPEIIEFMGSLRDIFLAAEPGITATAKALDAVNKALDNGPDKEGVNNPAGQAGFDLGLIVRERLAKEREIIKGQISGFFTGLAEDLQGFLDVGLFGPVFDNLGVAVRTAFTNAFAVPIGVIGGPFVVAIENLLGRLRPHVPDFLSIGRLSVSNFISGFSWTGVLGTGLTTAVAVLLGNLRLNLPSFGQIARSAVAGFIGGFNWSGTLGGGLIRAARALLATLSDLADQISTAARGIFTAAGSYGGTGGLPNGGNRAGAPVQNRRGPIDSTFQGPRRANGGLISRPEIAMIGEAGPELILPLTRPKRMQQLMDEHGLTQTVTSSHRVEVRAPIHVHGGANTDPEQIARAMERRLMRMVS